MTALTTILSARGISILRFAPHAAAALCAAFLAAAASAGPAGAQIARTPCGDRATVLRQLAAKYAEAPVSMGLTNTGAVLEVLTSDSGTWTVLVTTPQGVACLMAAGEHWEPVDRKKAAFAPSSAAAVH